MNTPLPSIPNGGRLGIAEIPVLGLDAFRETVARQVEGGSALSALFGAPAGGGIRLYAILAAADTGRLSVAASEELGGEYPALTPDCESLDVDANGTLDLIDFARLQNCFSGDVPADPLCGG